MTEDQQNALAFIRRGQPGDLAAAINIAGKTFVEAHMDEYRAGDPKEAS